MRLVPMRRGAPLGLLLVAACAPHLTRPPTEAERAGLGRMVQALKAHAGRTGDPGDELVATAADDVVRSDRVLLFEDSPRRYGYVILGRLYLHDSLFDDDGAWEAFSLEMLYHEGVHLTQSCCELFLTPRRMEAEAKARTRKFFERFDWDQLQRRHRGRHGR